MDVAAEYVRRLLEAKYDLVSVADLTKLTDSLAFQAVLTETRTHLEVSRTNLRDALLTVAREAGETAEDRDELAAACAQGEIAWRFVRIEVERGLLNPLPEAMPDEQTMKRRRKVFAQILGPTEAEFGRISPDKKVQALQDAADLARQAPTQKVLGDDLAELIIQRFSPAAAAIEAHRKDFQREQVEDREAFQKLFAARDAFDRAHTTHALVVEAALTRANRLDELGRFLRAQDPAYRARRAGGRPMKEEEDVGAVTTELGTTPEAIVEPVPG